MLIPHECHKIPHESPLQCLLSGRQVLVAPISASFQSRTSTRHEHKDFGQRKRGSGGGRQRRSPLRQLHALLGVDEVIFSAAVDGPDESGGLDSLLVGLCQSYG